MNSLFFSLFFVLKKSLPTHFNTPFMNFPTLDIFMTSKLLNMKYPLLFVKTPIYSQNHFFFIVEIFILKAILWRPWIMVHH